MPKSDIAGFRRALEESGFTCDEIAADGQIHRFHVTGDRNGSRNGWYFLHANGIIAGAYGSWKTGLKKTWSSKDISTM